ncbi:hypothetical protein CANMA_000984 [Candida margitis]|uniref:uncharacterized protein n=1 Tax=Candida margitis TaxID=1775924 RepID=UPI0022276F80|nr:uncharacterized protein CANMA_000984 [Candida margitis]KAI5969944.1 hypothetical protein CANMA_000984 [Candida margitis]
MGIERFIYKPQDKRLVLLLLKDSIPSVSYDEDDTRVYMVRCPLQYKSFIEKLLHQNPTVVLQYQSLTELCQLLNLLRPLERGGPSVIVSVDADSEISTKSIITFQLVRYLCQKHHCDLISVNQMSLYDVTNLDLPVKPTYEESDGLVLSIPKSWDTWSKIVLHGKSVALDEPGIIRSEETLHQIDDEYSSTGNATMFDNYLEKYTSSGKQEEALEVPKTLHEFVEAVFS